MRGLNIVLGTGEPWLGYEQGRGRVSLGHRKTSLGVEWETDQRREIGGWRPSRRLGEASRKAMGTERRSQGQEGWCLGMDGLGRRNEGAAGDLAQGLR